MRAPGRLAFAIMPLLLTACWAGKPFYAVNEVRAPIAEGDYETHIQGVSERGRFKVAVRSDGYTTFTEPNGDTDIGGFATLPGNAGLFVAWFAVEEKKIDGALWYGLLEKRGSEYLLTLPMCEETRSLAESVGARFNDDPKAPICEFHDRASLESGLRRVAADGMIQPMRLVPIEKKSKSD